MKRILVCGMLFATAFLLGQDKPAPNKTESDKAASTKAAPSKNPVSDAVRDILPRRQQSMIAAVEEMPADKFNYSPTPAQITFGHMVEHMIMSNIELCSKAGSMPHRRCIPRQRLIRRSCWPV